MEIKSHKDLEVYKDSIKFVVMIYNLTKSLPSEEKFGLISQLRRASVSIPSNISEGAARKNTKEFIQFLYHSLGSATEIETQLEIVNAIGFEVETKDAETELHRIIVKLTRLISSLKRKV